MPDAISPIHTTDDIPKTIEEKIDVFEARVNGWQLDIAQSLIDNQVQHSDFAKLHIVINLFEVIGKYRAGYTETKKSAHYFKEGMRYVFNQVEQDKEAEKHFTTVYQQIRNGLYHIGHTMPGIRIVSSKHNSFSRDPSTGDLWVNPDGVILDLRSRINDYITELRCPENVDLRKNFEIRYDVDNNSPTNL